MEKVPVRDTVDPLRDWLLLSITDCERHTNKATERLILRTSKGYMKEGRARTKKESGKEKE
jgi:hypothetical protein